MKISDTDQFPMDDHQRFIHIVTLVDGKHKYIYFIDRITQKKYVEEETKHGLIMISENIMQEIEKILLERGLLNTYILENPIRKK